MDAKYHRAATVDRNQGTEVFLTYTIQTCMPIHLHMSSNDIRVLIVDDDNDLRAALTDFISRMGVKVRTAGDLAEAQYLLQSEPVAFDLVLTDLKIPGGSGTDVLRTAHARNLDSLVTIITGYASMESAIEAIRLGAYNYVTKPFSFNDIGVQVRNMVERVSLSKENARLSLRLQELYKQINRDQSDLTSILRGQEEFRKQLQDNSRKLDEIIVRLNSNHSKN
jgi:DNA-binding NtrC family response regulator